MSIPDERGEVSFERNRREKRITAGRKRKEEGLLDHKNRGSLSISRGAVVKGTQREEEREANADGKGRRLEMG